MAKVYGASPVPFGHFKPTRSSFPSVIVETHCNVNEKPVFYDVKGKRKRGVLGIGAALGLFTAVLLTIVVIGCFLLPFIPGLPGGKPVVMRSTHPPLINAHGDEMRQANLILSQRKAALEKEIDEAKRL